MGRRQMISDRNGGVITCGMHVDVSDSGYQYSIRAKRVNKNGEVQWGKEGINVADSVTLNTSFNIASNYDEGFIIGLQICDIETETTKWLSKGVNSHGVVTWSNDSIGGKVVTDQEGNAIFLFWGKISNDEFYHLALRVNSRGQKLWENDVIYSQRGSGPIISDLKGGFIVTWYEIGAGSGWGNFCSASKSKRKFG